MNRAIISIFLAALVILLISSHDTFASRRHNVPMVPPREIQHIAGVIRPDSIPTKRVSLTLWSSNDAGSRIENMKQASLARRDPDLTHIGVNIDDTPDIFKEFLRRDNLDADPNQYLVDDEAAHSLASTYGYGTWYY